ncbi:MAG: dihydroorotate dehydrogenase electron transfer subunit [Planctomycetaceae bacterium]|jgi:dihydroorotate dehydrogenase electron transfer subunit|nr:dihydroorotate dehydrogenase electron transfer subunit [Planctomycetaceae bacterium]
MTLKIPLIDNSNSISSVNAVGGSGNSDIGIIDSSMFCSQRKVCSGEGIVIANECIADFTFKLSIAVEGNFPVVRAGQFIMIRLANNIDLLLGRPLAIYRVRRNDTTCDNNDIIEVIYLVAGRVTSRFSELTVGLRVRFWGPLGRGFDIELSKHTILVAGGVGHTPFLMLAENLSKVDSNRVTLLYGAKNKSRVVPLDDFVKIGVDVRVATDDGSIGFKGLVTELVEHVYRKDELTHIFSCGASPMLKATFNVASKLKLPCIVSLETPMSCGIGLCYGCVVKIKDENEPNGWTYQRTCVEGPAFNAYKLFF